MMTITKIISGRQQQHLARIVIITTQGAVEVAVKEGAANAAVAAAREADAVAVGVVVAVSPIATHTTNAISRTRSTVSD